MPGLSSPSDRKLVRAISAADEPGMRKLIVGMLTKDAWVDEAGAEPVGHAVDVTAAGEPDELSKPNIKAVLRWTFDIDLTDG